MKDSITSWMFEAERTKQLETRIQTLEKEISRYKETFGELPKDSENKSLAPAVEIS